MILETERLILRELEGKDAEFMFELMTSEGWLKYIGDRNIQTVKDAENYINDRIRKSYEEYGFGFYAIELKSNGESTGICGLVKRPELDHVDIGFGLLPQYEGKGLGYEASVALQKYAHEVLKIEKLLAITLEINHRSIRLLEKLGLQFDKKIIYAEEEILLYSEQ